MIGLWAFCLYSIVVSVIAIHLSQKARKAERILQRLQERADQSQLPSSRATLDKATKERGQYHD
jgi:hypothetical protein